MVLDGTWQSAARPTFNAFLVSTFLFSGAMALLLVPLPLPGLTLDQLRVVQSVAAGAVLLLAVPWMLRLLYFGVLLSRHETVLVLRGGVGEGAREAEPPVALTSPKKGLRWTRRSGSFPQARATVFTRKGKLRDGRRGTRIVVVLVSPGAEKLVPVRNAKRRLRRWLQAHPA